MSLIKKSYEVVAEDLEKMIEEGIMNPGERIKTIDRLAEQYGVGKSTIREALSQLKARGLIESRQGEGTYVKRSAKVALTTLPPLIAGSAKELTYLLQVRKMIETGCAELAAQAREAEHLAQFEEILESMAVSIENEEMSRIYDIQFHRMIATSTGNPYLIKMMESLSDAMNHTIRDTRNLWLYSRHDSGVRLFQEHCEIYAAIKEQDGAKARDLVTHHLRRVEEALDGSREP
ncbi:FadR/GntR family transcriptional regulator [Aneurinibacillus sp. Ricciae_BoGa-3]|uniref:FadR/GntR family transcriptional regulator n=1 Tax=Aneurinibacillus sp. Ricciae_BoGa-3 TaxID=3022697 RepID=UPI00234161B5|nr:FadR/GntR family transcriptional regulator [Aneurinibacillus sp. Ricciae_BoGa-3]WCK55111.1 FadR/GntR family transcriptional regulator [Aneurinibacillus sp. Ricciae_BoGa-3]